VHPTGQYCIHHGVSRRALQRMTAMKALTLKINILNYVKSCEEAVK